MDAALARRKDSGCERTLSHSSTNERREICLTSGKIKTREAFTTSVRTLSWVISEHPRMMPWSAGPSVWEKRGSGISRILMTNEPKGRDCEGEKGTPDVECADMTPQFGVCLNGLKRQLERAWAITIVQEDLTIISAAGSLEPQAKLALRPCENELKCRFRVISVKIGKDDVGDFWGNSCRNSKCCRGLRRRHSIVGVEESGKETRLVWVKVNSLF